MECVAVAFVELFARYSARRVLGMQVEGKPCHGSAVPALEPLGRGLAEAAERSDVVGPDPDGQGFHAF